MKLFATAFILTITFLLPASGQNGRAGKTPAITLKDLNGRTVRLADLKGKIVLLNFWATWCVPCAAEVPELVKWQDEYRKIGLQVVGITYPPANSAVVRRFIRKNRINYPILIGSKATKRLFDAGDTLPVTVIIDRKGKMVDRIHGVIFADEFEIKIKSLFDGLSVK